METINIIQNKTLQQTIFEACKESMNEIRDSIFHLVYGEDFDPERGVASGMTQEEYENEFTFHFYEEPQLVVIEFEGEFYEIVRFKRDMDKEWYDTGCSTKARPENKHKDYFGYLCIKHIY